MNKYRARYDWWIGGSVSHGEKMFDAPNPISALNQFHQWMQWGRELARGTMDVIRPNLCSGDYKLLSLHHSYQGEPVNRVRPQIEAQVDLPNSPNPNLNKVVNAYDDVTVEFGFVKDIDQQRESEFEKAHS